MTPWWWSVALAAIGIVGLVLAGAKRPSGWLVGLAAQVLWVVYAAVTGQWGFYLSAAAYGVVYALNYTRWLRSPIRSDAARYARLGPELQAQWDDGYAQGVQVGFARGSATVTIPEQEPDLPWGKHDSDEDED